MDTAAFADFVDGLDYPMYVVTATSAEGPSGCLVGFATQTSIDPPRLLVCLSMANHTHRVAAAAELLAVHVLSRDQHDLAARFGGSTGDRTDKFAGVAWTAGPGGVPLLTECPRRLVGRVLARHPLGDHTGLLLEPLAVHADAQWAPRPLTLADVGDVEPGHPA